MKAADYPLGFIPLDKATLQKYYQGFSHEMTDSLPVSYDAWALGIVSVAKDQGLCGSCWLLPVWAPWNLISKRPGRHLPCTIFLNSSCFHAMRMNLAATAAIHLPFISGRTGDPILNRIILMLQEMDPYPACIQVYAQIGYCTTIIHNFGTENIKASLFDKGPGPFSFAVHGDFQSWWDTALPGSVYTNAAYDFRGGHEVC